MAPSDDTAVVFDIGGTWFRSGLYDRRSGILHRDRRQALSFHAHPRSAPGKLQEGLADYLVARVREYGRERGLPLAKGAISLGAAMNANTAFVYGSGPLWGPDATAFDLGAALAARDPGIQWTIVNDITAALVHYAACVPAGTCRKIFLITVSSGLGGRLIDTRSGAVPADRIHGLQGEIGHLPIDFTFLGRRIDLRCDCGGANHAAAFSSGRGISQLLEYLERAAPDWWAELAVSGPPGTAERDRVAILARELASGNPRAAELIDAVTKPLADIIRLAFTLDPEIDRIVLTGGVAQGLEATYRDSLLRNLERGGLYIISGSEPDFFRTRIVTARPDEADGLIGAGLVATGPVLADHRA